jgi:hypothetical protein
VVLAAVVDGYQLVLPVVLQHLGKDLLVVAVILDHKLVVEVVEHLKLVILMAMAKVVMDIPGLLQALFMLVVAEEEAMLLLELSEELVVAVMVHQVMELQAVLALLIQVVAVVEVVVLVLHGQMVVMAVEE